MAFRTSDVARARAGIGRRRDMARFTSAPGRSSTSASSSRNMPIRAASWSGCPTAISRKGPKHAVLYMHDGQNLFDKATAGYGMEWEIDEHLSKADRREEGAPDDRRRHLEHAQAAAGICAVEGVHRAARRLSRTRCGRSTAASLCPTDISSSSSASWPMIDAKLQREDRPRQHRDHGLVDGRR